MLENCRWLLYVSRFCGCHPHTIDERSRVPINFRLLLIYSLIVCAMYSVAGYYIIALTSNNFCHTNNVKMSCVLENVNRYNWCLYMVLTSLFSCLRHAEFERAVAIACKFDDLMKYYNNWSADNKRKNYYLQWLIILAIVVAWLIVATLRKTAMPQIILYTYGVHIIMRITFSLEIAKFCFLYDALYRRFYCLNGLYHKLTGIDIGINIGISVTPVNRLTISNLQRLHNYLIDATNHFTSYYSPQLLCWIICMSLEAISYTFHMLYETGSILVNYIEFSVLFYFSLQVIAISRICHLTCDQANALAETIFLTPALKCIKFSTELIELGIRLRLYPLRIRVCGLFNLDNHFAISDENQILTVI